MSTIKIAVAGCCGRMGKRLCALVSAADDLELASAFERAGMQNIVQEMTSCITQQPMPVITTSAEEAIKVCDVLIDFTFPAVSLQNLAYVQKYKKKAVIGSTGFEDAQLAELKKISAQVPLVVSPNMSVGVNLLFKISSLVASILNDDYDVEIVEFHHKHKKDAPSGTAAKLAEVIAEARKVSLATKGVYGRKGITGEREKGTIGIHAVRGGDVVGDHTVSFLADGERVELSHRASSRDAFAQGALVAARFIAGKSSGLYSMHDVLGI